jgi:pyruvate kinase
MMFQGIDLRDRVPMARLVDVAVEAVLGYTSHAFVFVPTHSGSRARSIARFRLPVWIIAVCPQGAACPHLQFSFGVYAVHESEMPRDWCIYIRDWLQAHGLEADLAVLTQERGTVDSVDNYTMEIVDLSQGRQEHGM